MVRRIWLGVHTVPQPPTPSNSPAPVPEIFHTPRDLHKYTMFAGLKHCSSSLRAGLNATRQFSMLNKPLITSSLYTPVSRMPAQIPQPSTLSLLLNLIQRRFKSRGNTYQPSTLKRKRTFGFLARLRSRGGRKILQRRKAKGRWYLTH